MSVCCAHNREAARFFGWFARRYRKRFARKGFEPSQKNLIEGLAQAGIAGATLLEIGCGVGALHQQLLRQGAARVTGVDLSAKMLDEARAAAREQGLTGRIDYREGDFVALAGGLPAADVVILDKVICCYPDAEALIGLSAAKAGRALGVTIPRNRRSVRLLMGVTSRALALIRCGFRSYVHEPALIERGLADAGFERAFERQTFVWLTRVYVKRAGN